MVDLHTKTSTTGLQAVSPWGQLSRRTTECTNSIDTLLFSLVLTLIGSTINILNLWYLIGKLYLFTKFNPLHGVVTWRRRQNFYCRSHEPQALLQGHNGAPWENQFKTLKFEIFKPSEWVSSSKSSQLNSTSPKKTLERPRPTQDP